MVTECHVARESAGYEDISLPIDSEVASSLFPGSAECLGPQSLSRIIEFNGEYVGSGVTVGNDIAGNPGQRQHSRELANRVHISLRIDCHALGAIQIDSPDDRTRWRILDHAVPS